MKNRTACMTCGGSGQISYFKGVSRFLLSQEECSECAGLGYVLEEDLGPKDEDRSFTPNIKGKKDVD